MRSAIIFFLLLSVPVQIYAQTRDDYKKEQFVYQEDTLKYRILFPDDFNASEKYPVVLFLHGAGERGNDNESQLVHGSDLFLEKRKEFPAIVIFPQAPEEDYWAKVEIDRDTLPLELNFANSGEPTRALDLVMSLMDSISSQDYVDIGRLYVGGLSMGGMGTFELLSRRPDMFAAAFAICGGGDPARVSDYAEDFNIWIFHGEKDDMVLPKYSKIMAREINSAGGNAKLSLYPNANHNSWDSAFAEPYLLPWLFKHKKNN